ncbi:zinc finger protein 320-like [Contarinia nasturtii]|uniref:zinc finger protein 320-like n=1 Tax=Contarinia nasturtii TaxID=265458 RepID=UPI0012D3B281|nr:zinc finger protein 320-like [Contarinia nasturtii]
MDIASKYTSTVTSSNESNIVSHTKGTKITARSTKTSKEGASNRLPMKKRFKCQLCDYCSDYNWLIKRHMRSHTGEKPYRCDICRKGFTTLQHMKKHKITHTDEIPFHCRGCFSGFSLEVDQKAHYKVCKSRRYECHFCKKYVGLDITHLKIHMRKHNGEKPFRCRICMKVFVRKYHLKRHHMRIHTGEKPYRCDICQKGFTEAKGIKRHKVTHTDEIPFHCRGCFTGFSQKTDQEAHENVCKYRRYECHICKKFVTANKNNFKQHMRTHNGEKPFRCEICMMRFTQKGHLKKHLNHIHTKINP